MSPAKKKTPPRKVEGESPELQELKLHKSGPKYVIRMHITYENGDEAYSFIVRPAKGKDRGAVIEIEAQNTIHHTTAEVLMAAVNNGAYLFPSRLEAQRAAHKLPQHDHFHVGVESVNIGGIEVWNNEESNEIEKAV